MPHLSLRLFGGLQVLVDGAPVTAFESDKVRALLAYLAVEIHPQPRLALADLLWPAMPEGSARHNLSQVLFNLRQVIGDRQADPPLLLISRDRIGMNPAGDQSSDVMQCKRLLAACDTHPHPTLADCADCAVRLHQVVDLYQGDFLHHFFLNDSPPFEEWALLQREHWRRRVLTALSQLTLYHERVGDYTSAIQSCERQLLFDAWREESHQALMRLLARSGQRSAALAQYERCRRILAAELGITPSAETTVLYEQIKAGVLGRAETVTEVRPPLAPPDLPAVPPPSASAVPPLYQLPAQLTPFIGREQELVAIKALLADADCRLLTLVGAGGMGKTRLALAAAAQQQGVFAQGIVFVPLAAVTDAQLLPSAIADAIGFPFFGPTALQQQLLNYLRDKAMLLVLDNLEQLLTDEACSRTVLAILQQAPAVKLLITSREPLHVQGEWLFAVEGMGAAAMALFNQSVRRAQAGAVLSPSDESMIEQICRLVGEMPLGIELAAAWARSLSYAEIAQEIERNFDFLSSTMRDLPPRHRSLRVVFDQSWSLLSPAEQRGLCQAAIFCGGFRREAAAPVAGLSLTLLATLVHKFLLRHGAEGRYDLHEVVRQYAALRLQENAQEEQLVRERHALYYLDQVQAFADALHSGRQQAALAAITADMGNIRLALTWALANAQVHQVQRVAGALRYYYDLRSTFPEAEATFRQAAELTQRLLTQGQIDPVAGEVALGEFQAHWAWFLGRLGVPPPSRRLALLDHSLTLLRRHDAQAALADALATAGVCCWHIGQWAQAEQYLQESRAINHCLGRAWAKAAASTELGWVTYHRGDADAAEAILRESLGESRLLGDARTIALSVGYLSHVLHSVGRLSEMHDLLGEILALAQATGDRIGMLYAQEHLAYEAQSLGQHVIAQMHFAAFFALSQEIGNVQGQARVLNALGRQAVQEGEWHAAQAHFFAALAIAHRVQLASNVLDALVGIAMVRLHEGAYITALHLLRAVLHHPACTQVVKRRAEQLDAELHAHLPAAQLATVATPGEAPSVDALASELLAAYRATPDSAVSQAQGR